MLDISRLLDKGDCAYCVNYYAGSECEHENGTDDECSYKRVHPDVVRELLERETVEDVLQAKNLLEAAASLPLQRSSVYTTDWLTSHTNLGLLWTSLLQTHYNLKLEHPIPADLTCLMMAALKLGRASYSSLLPDNYLDAVVYTWFAHQAKEKERES